MGNCVEVAGLLTDNEHKFGRASQDYAEFFCLTSEVIARTFEASNSCRAGASLEQIFQRIDQIEGRIGILNVFRQYNAIAQHVSAVGSNLILIFNKRAVTMERTQVRSYESFAQAVREIGKIERANMLDGDPFEAVLVRAVTGPGQGSIESAFRNYFADTRDFVEYIDKARELLPND